VRRGRPPDAERSRRALRDRPGPRRRAVARGAGLVARRAAPAHGALSPPLLDREPTIPLFDGAAQLLSDLDDAGFLLAVATGKTRAGLDRAIAKNGLAGRFHATRCADEGLPKPHPDMLLALMEDSPPTRATR
jgi:phosphoglycolate phosphatase-like HAD superfamily hydrolase